MLLDNTKNSTETLHTEWQSQKCNPMPFFGFIMSAVIRGGGRWDMSWHSWVQIARSFSKATLCSQISPVLFPPDKAATFNSRIKSPKSQHWHLAKATEDGAEQWDLMLHWLVWPTEQEGAGPGGKIKSKIDNWFKDNKIFDCGLQVRVVKLP